MIKLYNILFESIFSNLLNKYPNIKTDFIDYQNIKPKYLPWIAKQLSVENLENYTSDEVKNILSDFELATQQNLIDEKDINKYENINNVIATIQNKKQSRKNKKQELAKELAQIDPNLEPKFNTIFENEKYKIIEPLNKAAACIFGKETNWCISTPSEKGVNFFGKARYRGAKHFIIHDNFSDVENYKNVVVTIYPNKKVEITDGTNKEIEQMEFFNLFPEYILEFFDNFFNEDFSFLT